MQATSQEQKITSKTAALLNGVSTKTLLRWAQAGMPHLHLKSKYLFYQSEIDQWIHERFRVMDGESKREQ